MDAWISLLNEECARDAALEASISLAVESGEAAECIACGFIHSTDASTFTERGWVCDSCHDELPEVH